VAPTLAAPTTASTEAQVTTTSTVASAEATSPTGWRDAAEIESALEAADMATATPELRTCLANSPFSADNTDAAMLVCLDDVAQRHAYGLHLFDTSEERKSLADFDLDEAEPRACVADAMASDIVHDRLIELATTARYWDADRLGDSVADEVLSRQFGTCWQQMALG
jgi:hypothetical protein